jgi:hypothetical protein
MRPIELRLERNPELPKWDVLIQPTNGSPLLLGITLGVSAIRFDFLIVTLGGRIIWGIQL